MFSKKIEPVFVGIYLMYDPKLPEKAVRFSPPFFSVSDDVACQALLETLRRHSTSFDQLYASEFLRLDLWRAGSVDLESGKVVSSSKHRYKVCNVGEYLQKDFVRHYMSTVPYPSEAEIKKGF